MFHEMRLYMKKIILLGIALLGLTIITGCSNTSDNKSIEDFSQKESLEYLQSVYAKQSDNQEIINRLNNIVAVNGIYELADVETIEIKDDTTVTELKFNYDDVTDTEYIEYNNYWYKSEGKCFSLTSE